MGESMVDGALAKLTRASKMLAEAKTLDDVLKIKDLAQAAETYARAAKLGLEAQNNAAEVTLRAERKAGESAGSRARCSLTCAIASSMFTRTSVTTAPRLHPTTGAMITRVCKPEFFALQRRVTRERFSLGGPRVLDNAQRLSTA